MLLFSLIAPTLILFFQNIMIETSGQSAWLVAICSSSVGLATLWIIFKLDRRFPRTPFQNYSKIILGKFFGKMVSILYALFFFTLCILEIRQFAELVPLTMETDISRFILITLVVLVAGFGAYMGIEVIVRANQFILPIALIIFISILGLALLQADWENILPLPSSVNQIQQMIEGAIPPASVFGEVVIIMIFLPIVNQPQEVWRKGVGSILAVVAFFTLSTFVILTVIGPNLSGHLLLPFWYLAKSVQYQNYIQRIEGIVFFSWLIGLILKATLFYYLTTWMTVLTLGIKSYRPVIYCLAPILASAAAFIFKNTLQLRDFLAQYWPPFGLCFEIILPLLLLITAILRKKGIRRERS